MSSALLIASTHVDSVFAERVIAHLSQNNGMPYMVAADGGLTTFNALGIAPRLLVGDFDTVRPELLERYVSRDDIEVLRHNPVKDDSDLALAVEAVAEKGYTEIYVLGALGGRCDHSLANMRLCYAWKKKGVSPCTHGHTAKSRERIWGSRQLKKVQLMPKWSKRWLVG